MSNPSPLHDKRILIVEDEYFLAEELEGDLTRAGAVTLESVPSVPQALALLDADPAIDAVVLDVNLGGEMSYPVADALMARGIPFVFATGYGDGELDGRFPQIVRCEKPLQFRELERALTSLLPV